MNQAGVLNYSTMHKIVTFGEIMLRLATPEHLRFGQSSGFDATFGGGEANVAVSLAQFGHDAEFVTALPANAIAQSCLRELRGFGVDVHNCKQSGERMGIYFIEKGAVNRPSKVIYDRAHSAISQVKVGDFDWANIFKGADWFHWTGITPAISQSAADVCLEAVIAASKAGVKISCDLNYRKNLWKYGKTASEVMPQLVSYSDVIIGNEEDAQKVFGIKSGGFDAQSGHIDSSKYEEVASELMKLFPKAQKVAITQRGSINADHNTWAAVLYDGFELKMSRSYDITDIVDRVGGGDSFAAGLIHGLLEYDDDVKALEFAVAASALKHTIEGDFNRVSAEEVLALVNGNGCGRVSR